jgi:RHS repeat-associated protein
MDGQVLVGFGDGIRMIQPVDLRRSPPSSLEDSFGGATGDNLLGHEINAGDGFGGVLQPALVYNSDTVNSQLLSEIDYPPETGMGVPTTLQLQTTFNGGSPSAWVNFTPPSGSGQTYAMGSQLPAVSSSGEYSALLHAYAYNGSTTEDYFSGPLVVVDLRVSSPFGPGWSMAGIDQLLPLGNVGAVMYYGSGEPARWFAMNGSSYVSPSDDFGTLVKNADTSFTYTSKHGVKWNFNPSGALTSITDPHNLAVTVTYSGSLVNTLQMPDGGVTTFTYSSNLLATIVEPGNRTLTVTHNVSGDVTGLTDADGSLRTFTYDSAHHLTNEQWGPLNVTYTYDSQTGVVTQIDAGGGTVYTIGNAAKIPLQTNPAATLNQVVGTLTDPLNRTTTYTIDTLGRLSKVQTPDGGTQSWALDSHEQMSTYTDQLNRVTTYTYDYSTSGAGDLTQVTYPDGTIGTIQYEQTFHQPTQITDQANNLTTMTYNTSTGDLLTIKDAAGDVTSLTWTGGLLQTVTDPLGHVSSFSYDSARRLQTAVDALGNTATTTYDANGNPATYTDALGRVSSLVYDVRDRLVQVTDANGGVTTFAYNAISQRIGETRPLGDQVSYIYDQHGWLTQQTDAVGSAVQRSVTMIYDTAGELLSQTEGNASSNAHLMTTSYAYDAVGRATRVIEGYGTTLQRTTTIAYNLAGDVTKVTDPLGHIASYSYDAMDRTTRVDEAYGSSVQRSVTFIYDSVGNVRSMTTGIATSNSRVLTTSYGYDAIYRETQLIEAYGTTLKRTTTLAYDAASNLIQVTDPLGRIGSYSYDLDNRVARVDEAYGSSAQRSVTMIYDPVGNVLSETTGIATSNANPATTSFAYDALNRTTQVIDGFGTTLARTTTIAYDKESDITQVTDPLGRVTSYSYDALNRMTQEDDAYGSTVQRSSTMIYDATDNLLSRTDGIATTNPQVVTTSFAYDALNRRTQEIDAYGVSGLQRTTTLAYDLGDNLTSVTDALNHTTTLQYDALNRQTSLTDARGGITTTTYDAADNVLTVKDPVNNVTTFQYDALSRLTQQTDPLNHSSTYAYDAGDRLTSTKDRNGRRRDFTYDALDRLTSEVWTAAGGGADGRLTYSYDAASNLLTAVNANGAYTMSYDTLDRRTVNQEPFGLTLTATYDAVDNRTKLQDSLNGVTTFVYDALNRLTSEQFGGSGQTALRMDLTYTAQDEIATQTRYKAGTQTVGTSSFTYDALGQLTNLQHKDGSSNLLANYTYTYDSAGRLSTEVLNGSTTTYQYDAANQLTSDTANSYGYDLNGNRNTTGYTTGTGNELTNDGTFTYTYDNEGNLTKKSKGASAETWYYGYDEWNHLISVKKEATDGGTIQMQATYTYDALGNRLEQDVWTGPSPGTLTVARYGYDGPNAWADLNGSNALQMRRLYLNGVDAVFARINSSGTAAWYLPDRLGSIRDITDNNTGAVIDHLNYDGFGNVTSESQQTNGDRFHWAGGEQDGETGLYHFGWRFYDPKVGRWTSQDPRSFAAGDPNLYRYVGNSSVNATDPSGLQERRRPTGMELAFPNGHPYFISPIKSESERDEDAFREAARRNGVPQKDIDLILGTALKTPRKDLPWAGRHQVCFDWVSEFERRLDEALNARNKKNPTIAIRGIHRKKVILDVPLYAQGNEPRDVPWVEQILPLFLDIMAAGGPARNESMNGLPWKCPQPDPDAMRKRMLGQHHTVLQLTLKDGSIWYIDMGPLQRVITGTGNINNLRVGPWVVTPANKLPRGWKPTNLEGVESGQANPN